MPESCCRVRPSGFGDLADDWTESRQEFMLPWLHDGVRFGRPVESRVRPWWRYGAELSLMVASLIALRSAR